MSQIRDIELFFRNTKVLTLQDKWLGFSSLIQRGELDPSAREFRRWTDRT
jgi:hypothetical protein